SLRYAAAVHVLFPTFAEWLPPDIRRKTRAIPNYVSPTILTTRPRDRRQKTIIAVGRLSKVKNYSVLVDAWARLAASFPEWNVRLFGVGAEKERLARQIAEAGIVNSFHLEGHKLDIGPEY